jgi:excisionase family DNA binding protein
MGCQKWKHKKTTRMESSSVPILIPLEPATFWSEIRKIIQEELTRAQRAPAPALLFETPGLTQKPLYRMSEVCRLFGVSRPTVYDWIRHGKLRRVKIRSRVYFLGAEIDQLLH